MGIPIAAPPYAFKKFSTSEGIGVVIGLAKTLPTNEIDVLLPGTIVALSVGLLVYLYRRRQHWWDRGWDRERFFAILTSADALFYLVLFLIGVVALMH